MMDIFTRSYLNIISEAYKTFPIPQKFISDIENAVKTLDIGDSKEFYMKNYLNYFKNSSSSALKAMAEYIENNPKFKLVLIVFQSFKEENNEDEYYYLDGDGEEDENYLTYNNKDEDEEYLNNLSKYEKNNKYFTEPIEYRDIIDTCMGMSIDTEFIADKKNISVIFLAKNCTNLKEVINHELIHWLQTYSNIDKNSSFGMIDLDEKYKGTKTEKKGDSFIISSNIYKLVQKDDLKWLIELSSVDSGIPILDAEYFLDKYEFEAWVSSVCNIFKELEITIEQFEKIIKNKKLFELKFQSLLNKKSYTACQCLIFSELCYLISKNTQNENRWWYLLEAIKENYN